MDRPGFVGGSVLVDPRPCRSAKRGGRHEPAASRPHDGGSVGGGVGIRTPRAGLLFPRLLPVFKTGATIRGVTGRGFRPVWQIHVNHWPVGRSVPSLCSDSAPWPHRPVRTMRRLATALSSSGPANILSRASPFLVEFYLSGRRRLIPFLLGDGSPQPSPQGALRGRGAGRRHTPGCRLRANDFGEG